MMVKYLIAIIGIIASVGYICLDAIYSGGDNNIKQFPFSSAAWKHSTPIGNHRTVRSEMIEDLLRTHYFIGWKRSQIEDLLGPLSSSPNGFDQWQAVYVLGLERGVILCLDDKALGFNFDANGRVMEYGLAVN